MVKPESEIMVTNVRMDRCVYNIKVSLCIGLYLALAGTIK